MSNQNLTPENGIAFSDKVKKEMADAGKATVDKTVINQAGGLAYMAGKSAEQKRTQNDAERIRADFNSINEMYNDARNQINYIQELIPLFSPNWHKEEGHTDLTKLDYEKMMSLGNALIQNFTTSKSTLDMHRVGMDLLKSQMDLTLIDLDDEEAFMDFQGNCIDLNSKFVDWMQDYVSTTQAIASDVFNTINAARPADKQVKFNTVNLDEVFANVK